VETGNGSMVNCKHATRFKQYFWSYPSTIATEVSFQDIFISFARGMKILDFPKFKKV
jgi:hypothetical protein